jgi:hypothetical protein
MQSMELGELVPNPVAERGIVDLDVLEPCRETSQFDASLKKLGPEERARFYRQLEQVLAYSRRHYIDYQGKTHEREGLQALRASCEESTTLESEHAELLFALYSLRCANLGLEQIRGIFGVGAVNRLIEQRLDLYAGHGSERARAVLATEALGPVARAKALFAARRDVDTTHYRVSLIDGGAWYRTEALLPREEVASAELSQAALLALASFCDLSAERIQADVHVAAATAAHNCVKTREVLAPLLEPFMQAIADDERIRVDTAVLTCPTGLGLDEPAAIGQPADSSEYFRCHIVFRAGVEAPEGLGPKVTGSARKAIRGRMFQLKRKAIKNCFHAGVLFGVDVEKAYDYMIYANEDSHYPGHKVARVFTGGRSPIKLTVPERNIDLPRGLSDLRCFRGRESGEIFSVREQRYIIRYAELLETMLRETLRLGALVSRDAVPE